MYKDFSKRLNRDIKRMVDARVLQSQITSQMNMSTEQQIKAKSIDVNVVSHKKQRYAVWFGGSLLADTVSCPFSRITRSPLFPLPLSLNFFPTVTLKPSMMSTVLALLVTTKSLGPFCSLVVLFSRLSEFAIAGGLGGAIRGSSLICGT